MIRKFKFILPLIIAISLLTSFKAVNNNNTAPKDKVLLTILNYVLTQWHYEPKEINDSFSGLANFNFKIKIKIKIKLFSIVLNMVE